MNTTENQTSTQNSTWFYFQSIVETRDYARFSKIITVTRKYFGRISTGTSDDKYIGPITVATKHVISQAEYEIADRLAIVKACGDLLAQNLIQRGYDVADAFRTYPGPSYYDSPVEDTIDLIIQKYNKSICEV